MLTGTTHAIPLKAQCFVQNFKTGDKRSIAVGKNIHPNTTFNFDAHTCEWCVCMCVCMHVCVCEHTDRE